MGVKIIQTFKTKPLFKRMKRLKSLKSVNPMGMSSYTTVKKTKPYYNRNKVKPIVKRK